MRETTNFTKFDAVSAAANWTFAAHAVRDDFHDDWDFFLAEFDAYAAADEALALHAWRHHLPEPPIVDDLMWEFIVVLLDCWYEQASSHIGRICPRHLCMFTENDQYRRGLFDNNLGDFPMPLSE